MSVKPVLVVLEQNILPPAVRRSRESEAGARQWSHTSHAAFVARHAMENLNPRCLLRSPSHRACRPFPRQSQAHPTPAPAFPRSFPPCRNGHGNEGKGVPSRGPPVNCPGSVAHTAAGAGAGEGRGMALTMAGDHVGWGHRNPDARNRTRHTGTTTQTQRALLWRPIGSSAAEPLPAPACGSAMLSFPLSLLASCEQSQQRHRSIAGVGGCRTATCRRCACRPPLSTSPVTVPASWER